MNKKAFTIGKGILLVLGIGALAASVIVAPNIIQVIALIQKTSKKLDKYQSRSLRITLQRLKEQKFITIGEQDGKIIISITEKGKKRVLQYQIDDMKIAIPEKWDKKWRIVIFDIPNKKTLARNVLRDKLKELGFCLIQKSVWLYPYDCKDEIDFLKEVYEIRPFVKLAVAETIDNEEIYLRKFNLIK